MQRESQNCVKNAEAPLTGCVLANSTTQEINSDCCVFAHKIQNENIAVYASADLTPFRAAHERPGLTFVSYFFDRIIWLS